MGRISKRNSNKTGKDEGASMIMKNLKSSEDTDLFDDVDDPID